MMRITNSQLLTRIVGRQPTESDERTHIAAVELCDQEMNSRGRMFGLYSIHMPRLCGTDAAEKRAISTLTERRASYNPFLGGTMLNPKEVGREDLLPLLAGVRVGFESKPLTFATRDRFLIATNAIAQYSRLRRMGLEKRVIHGNLHVKED